MIFNGDKYNLKYNRIKDEFKLKNNDTVYRTENVGTLNNDGGRFSSSQIRHKLENMLKLQRLSWIRQR